MSDWNHNTYYYPLVIDALPAGASRALDVGCGEGRLSRLLADRVPQVVALEPHVPTLSVAAAAGSSGGRIAYVAGSLMTTPLAPSSFDLVAAVASLHHMDEPEALRRMASLARPGGRVVVIGLATMDRRDLPFAALSAVAHQWHHRRRPRIWRSTAPIVWPPARTYRDVRRMAREVLPGVEYRRRLLWRYSLVWQKPSPDS